MQDAANLFNEAQQVLFLRNTFLDLTNANTSLQEQNSNLLSELSSVQNEVNINRGYLQWYVEELKRFIFAIEEKKRELQYLDQLVDDNMKGYARYK